MKVVILSGGYGKRLWPISSEDKPKQFIEYGKENKSMLQRNYQLLKTLNYNISITSIKKYSDIIKEQTDRKIEIIEEPEKRDTFPAIANSLLYLLQNGEIKREDYVAFLPVDSCVEKAFYENFERYAKILERENRDIGLIGIKPKNISTQYGYIVLKQNKEQDYSIVDRFKEKPNIKEAEELVKNGALINSGVFIIKAGNIYKYVEKYIPNTTYEKFREQYNKLPATSFDYEVLEKEQELIAFKSNCDWSEIGSWNTFADKIDKIKGSAYAYNSENTVIINELNIPIISIGNKNMIIAASKEGILICDKTESRKLKEYLNNIEEEKNESN